MPYISNLELSSFNISMICIKLILVALVLSIVYNFALSGKQLIFWIKSKRRKQLAKITPFSKEDTGCHMNTDGPIFLKK